MHSARRRSVALAAAGAVVVAGSLAGCVGGDPKPTHTPAPSATPLYASEEEALAAAKDAYARYVEVSNQVAHDGWADLSPLKEVATGDALKADIRGGEKNRNLGLHTEGDATGEVKSVQDVGSNSVTVYACADFTNTRVLDRENVDRTNPNRTEIIAYELTLVPDGSRLQVGGSDRWSGKPFC